MDPATIFLDGQEGGVAGKANIQVYIEDVSVDDFNDLITQIEDIGGTYEKGETVATLKAETFDAISVIDTDTLCVVSWIGL